MYPVRTEYRLAGVPGDYKALHQFAREQSAHPRAKEDGFEEAVKLTLSFPTIYGVRDKRVIGIMGSQFHPKFGLVASPLHVDYDIHNHVPTALRLIDCYERVLLDAGVWQYLVVVPSWKPSSRRVFEEIKHGERLARVGYRMDLYRITIGA